MFIGHLPAGYILSKCIPINWIDKIGINKKIFTLVCVFGAIFPDLDMFYFYLVDNRQYHHHTYWTHFPVLWISLLLISSFFFFFNRTKKPSVYLLFFSVNGFLHMVLDSIVGDIWWLSPFYDKPFALFTVPALHQPWWLNFILHWSFLLEIAVLFWAILLFVKTKR